MKRKKGKRQSLRNDNDISKKKKKLVVLERAEFAETLIHHAKVGAAIWCVKSEAGQTVDRQNVD